MFVSLYGSFCLLQDPSNLTKRHCKKASGVVNQQAIGVEACTDAKGVILTTKNKSSKSDSC